MPGAPLAPVPSHSSTLSPEPERVQHYAKAVGVLLLITMFAGFFGEVYAPGRIVVSGDAAATAGHVVAMNGLFRLGFAAYLVEAVCDIALAMLFYVLLAPVNRHLSLLAAFFGLVSTAVFAGGELFYFAPSLLTGDAAYLKAFTPAQLEALTHLSLRLYTLASGIFMMFYGVAMLIRGVLIYRSRYLPRALGAIVAIAGAGFISNNLLVVLAPGYASDFLLLPMFVSILALTGWMLVRGVDMQEWTDRQRPPTMDRV